MDWLVWIAFIGTWYLAGREIDKLQSRIETLEDDNNKLKRDLDSLAESQSTRDL